MQTNSWVPIFPEQASSFAWQVDMLYFYLIAISVACTIPSCLLIFSNVDADREKAKARAPDEIQGSSVLAAAWPFLPSVMGMTIFLGVALVYYVLNRERHDAA